MADPNGKQGLELFSYNTTKLPTGSDCYCHNGPGGNHRADLEYISVANQDENPASNRLSVPTPSELGNLAELDSIVLSDNTIEGAILPELSNVGQPIALLLQDHKPSGLISSELGDLSNLKYQEIYNHETLTGSARLQSCETHGNGALLF